MFLELEKLSPRAVSSSWDDVPLPGISRKGRFSTFPRPIRVALRISCLSYYVKNSSP